MHHPEKTIIGNTPFGFTPESVETTLEQLQKERTDTQKAFADPNDQIRRFAENHIRVIETQIEALNKPADIVIQQIQGWYRQIQQLESEGLPMEDIIRTMAGQQQEIQIYYPLLRQEPWGYKVGQAFSALKTKISQ